MPTFPQIRIQEDVVEGTEPLHRAAYLGDDCVLTAFGNQQEDRWILGWRPAPWLDWKRIAAFAAYTFLDAGIRDLSIHVLRDDEFIRLELRNVTAAHVIVSDMRRSLRESGRPDMIVLGTERVQVEIIFARKGPSALTLLTPIGIARAFVPFVVSTHPHAALVGRNSLTLATQLFDRLLGPAFEPRMKNGHTEGERWESVAGGQAKQNLSE